MAHLFVRNSLNNLKAVKIDINFTRYTPKDSEGDMLWLIEVATTYPSITGGKINPVYINDIRVLDNLDLAIEDALSKIAQQIDWSPLIIDDSSPYITEMYPVGSGVSIGSNVYINIQEDHPSSGIDLSDMSIILNNGMEDFDITNECKIFGSPFNYNISWTPKNIVYDNYIKS